MLWLAWAASLAAVVARAQGEDLVGPAARVGDVICARAFQAAVGCASAERGVLQWAKPIGGNDGVAADDDFVFGVDASDRITAWKRASGETAWTSERFLYRGLSAPVIVGRTLVFGDQEGWLDSAATSGRGFDPSTSEIMTWGRPSRTIV